MSHAVGCIPDTTTGSDPWHTCLHSFILWAFPLFASVSVLLYGFIAWYLDEDAEHSLPKSLGTIVLVLLFLVWCLTSISIASAGISEAFFAIIIAGTLAIGIMVIGAYGMEGNLAILATVFFSMV